MNPESPEQEPYLPPYRPVLCELIRTGRRVQVKGPQPVKIVRDSLAPQVGPRVKRSKALHRREAPEIKPSRDEARRTDHPNKHLHEHRESTDAPIERQ